MLRGVYDLVAGFRPRGWAALALAAAACAACGDDGGAQGVAVGRTARPDAGADEGTGARMDHGCDEIELDGDVVIEHERDFTARYRMGEPYTRTVMLFGGEAIETDNALSNAYIMGLDKTDALMLAEQYPDFYLCSSQGGMAAADRIMVYDLVPASCAIHEQVVAAIRTFIANRAAGGDRTSLSFDGVPLTLESVTQNQGGQDVTDQVEDQSFHLVTRVEQLTGQSVLEFGTNAAP